MTNDHETLSLAFPRVWFIVEPFPKMVFVDVTKGERVLVTYAFQPHDRDVWKGYELKASDRGAWNLYWERTDQDRCIVRLVRQGRITLGEVRDWDAEPVQALRYSL